MCVHLSVRVCAFVYLGVPGVFVYQGVPVCVWMCTCLGICAPATVTAPLPSSFADGF